MTPPTTEAAEPATPTPTVCTCGYDLAGLPASGDAKCPECGAVVADIWVRPPSFFSVPMLLFFAFAPALGLIAVIAWGELSYEAYQSVIGPSGITELLGVWLCIGSPAAIHELFRVFRRPGRRWLAPVLFAVAVVLGAAGLTMLFGLPLM